MDRAGPFGQANEFRIVGETPELWDLLDRAAFAAMLQDHVMIRGQTGSGKEAIAAMICALGPDANGGARGTTLTKEEVEWCLAKSGGNVKAAAEQAGVSRQAFYRAMKRTGVTGKEGE